MPANMPYVPTDDEGEETPEESGEKLPTAAEERDALIAAGEAALRASGESLTEEKPKEAPKERTERTERDEQGRFKPAPSPARGDKPAEKGKPKEAPSSVIAQELAKREARQAERSSYQQKMQEAEQVIGRAQQLFQQAQQQSQEIARLRHDLNEAKRDPVAFLKQAGWSADDFINHATRAKDPAYQAEHALRTELEKRDHQLMQLSRQVQELSEARRRYDGMTQEAQQKQDVDAFLSSIPQDSPIWKDDRFDDHDDIVARARKVRQKYYDVTGKVATPQELGQYLHYEALKRRGGTAEPAGRENAGRPKAKGSRAVGSSTSSERRPPQGAKHIFDMTPSEEREYLIQVGNNALAGIDADAD